MSQTLRNRLKRIQTHSEMEYSEIIKQINQGAFYDDLNDEQKEMYCRYIGVERSGIETIEKVVAESEGRDPETALHFRLERKQPTPTPEEMQRRIEEVERIVNEVEGVL